MQVQIDVHVLGEHGSQLGAHSLGQRVLCQSSHLHRPHFRQKDVALLIHKEHVVVASCPPDADSNTITWQDYVVAVHAAAIGRGKVSLEEIGTKGLQA